MFFFFRKPKIQIDCFLPEKYAFVLEYAPIQKATKFIPSWFKGMNSINKDIILQRPIGEDYRNAKGCLGIINSLTEGFIVPLWSDLRLDWDENNAQYYFSDDLSDINFHSNDQARGFAENFWFAKLNSPWIIRFNRHLKVLLQPLTYHFGINSPIKTLHAIQETASSLKAINVNQFLLLEKSPFKRQEIINFGTPLIHMVPLSEYNYDLKCYVDDKEIKKISNQVSYNFSFIHTGIKQRAFDKKTTKKTTKES